MPTIKRDLGCCKPPGLGMSAFCPSYPWAWPALMMVVECLLPWPPEEARAEAVAEGRAGSPRAVGEMGRDANGGLAGRWAFVSRICTFISCSTKYNETLTLIWAPGIQGCNVNINNNEAILPSLCTCCSPSLAVWKMAAPLAGALGR